MDKETTQKYTELLIGINEAICKLRLEQDNIMHHVSCHYLTDIYRDDKGRLNRLRQWYYMGRKTPYHSIYNLLADLDKAIYELTVQKQRVYDILKEDVEWREL